MPELILSDAIFRVGQKGFTIVVECWYYDPTTQNFKELDLTGASLTQIILNGPNNIELVKTATPSQEGNLWILTYTHNVNVDSDFTRSGNWSARYHVILSNGEEISGSQSNFLVGK